MPNDLLSLDHVPTIEELRDYFNENDFTTLPQLDKSGFKEKDIKRYNRILKLIDEVWLPMSKKYGQKAQPSCYTNDYPPELLHKNLSHMIADQVFLLAKRPLHALKIIRMFGRKSKNRINPDKLLYNGVETLFKTVDYENIIKVSKENACESDFNPYKPLNYPAMDFNKKWNHTRSRNKTVSYEEIVENENIDISDIASDAESIAIGKISADEFMDSLSEKEKNILLLSMQGYSQEKIAEKLGYKTQGAVSKRMKLIREQFLEYNTKCSS